MGIVTKTGDDGSTGLYGAGRVRKDNPRVCAYGDVDELNAVIGCILAEHPPAAVRTALEHVQHELFAVGSDLATPLQSPAPIHRVAADDVRAVEGWIRELETALPPQTHFIVPGGTRLAALCHLARTVCRRAERSVVTLAACEQSNPQVQVYLNRLSDYLFLLARSANQADGREDVHARRKDKSA